MKKLKKEIILKLEIQICQTQTVKEKNNVSLNK